MSVVRVLLGCVLQPAVANRLEELFEVQARVLVLVLGFISEEVEIFVSASLAMKLREYTRNTPIRRNPVSKF